MPSVRCPHLTPLLRDWRGEFKLTRRCSAGQVGKLLGERWKALNDKQRAPYEAKAATDKKRYEDEKQAYNVRLTPSHNPKSLPCRVRSLTNCSQRPTTTRRSHLKYALPRRLVVLASL